MKCLWKGLASARIPVFALLLAATAAGVGLWMQVTAALATCYITRIQECTQGNDQACDEQCDYQRYCQNHDGFDVRLDWNICDVAISGESGRTGCTEPFLQDCYRMYTCRKDTTMSCGNSPLPPGCDKGGCFQSTEYQCKTSTTLLQTKQFYTQQTSVDGTEPCSVP